MAKKFIKYKEANEPQHTNEVQRAEALVYDCLAAAESMVDGCGFCHPLGEGVLRLALAEMLLRSVHAERRDIAVLRGGAACDAS